MYHHFISLSSPMIYSSKEQYVAELTLASPSGLCGPKRGLECPPGMMTTSGVCAVHLS